jgi:uracil-DNA glycosylase
MAANSSETFFLCGVEMSHEMEKEPGPRIVPKIEESWKVRLIDQFQKPYFHELKSFLEEEKKAGHTVYPPGSRIFNAFNLTPFDSLRVVIVGQDPYHGPSQAHGLCFSVLPPTPPPPSLVNIFKELKSDLGLERPAHGDLSSWAREGVLLLNTVLTVRARQAGSHRNKGWEEFTNSVIHLISKSRPNQVFVLWGKDAQSKENLIEGDHFIIKSSHPSPYSAHSGFLGSRPFSRINQYLQAKGISPIDWSI